MRINEITLRHKAGIIPYYIDKDGTPVMMFMIPSNPTFGGNLFQIGKGRIEPGEDLQQTAVREAEEELGLKQENIKQIKSLGTNTITGLDETYLLTVFVAEINNLENFNQPHYETGKRDWLTLKQFTTLGRQNQLPIVQKVNNLLRADGRDQVS